MNKLISLKKTAFTLAEMMIVLLILSLIMVAFVPVITSRSKASGGNIWRWAANNSDIYYGTGVAQGVAIGATGMSQVAGENSRLLINTNDNTQSHIIFQQGGVSYGRLMFDQYHNIGIGNIKLSGSNTLLPTSANGNSLSIGSNSSAIDIGTTAIGQGATAKTISDTAIGNGAVANGTKAATAVGDSAYAIGNRSIAMGSWANAQGYYAINIGCNNDFVHTTTYGAHANNAVAIGSNTNASGDNSIAIGLNSQAITGNSLALGDSAVANATGTYGDATALGAGATATYGAALAVGIRANASEGACTAIGVNASARGNGAVAIGSDSDLTGASATSDNQFVLGTANHKVFIPGALGVGTPFLPVSVSLFGTLSLNGTDFVNSDGTWTASDRRLKNVGAEYSDGLDKIRQIQPYNFTYKKDKKKAPKVGIIAQDLQKIFPNSVTKFDKKYLGIRKDDMFYAMINSIKQLDIIVQGLVNDFKSLIARVQKLETKVVSLINADKEKDKKIKSLEARLQKLEKLSKAK